MRKNIIVLMLALTFTLTACGDNKEVNNNEVAEVKTEIATQVTDTVIEVKEEKTDEEVKEQVEEKSLAGLATHMKDCNLAAGDTIHMAGEMIGAIEGLKYKEPRIEMYRYDTESDRYKTIESEGTVTLEDFNMTVTVKAYKDGYVLFCDDVPETDDIIAAFNSYFE